MKDIIIYNLDVLAVLFPDGTVIVSPPAIITTSCSLNIENFPYDEKICTMTWGRLYLKKMFFFSSFKMYNFNFKKIKLDVF